MISFPAIAMVSGRGVTYQPGSWFPTSRDLCRQILMFENNRDLGSPGQSIQLMSLSTFGEMDGRGVTKAEFLSKKGRIGMSWDVFAKWDLV